MQKTDKKQQGRPVINADGRTSIPAYHQLYVLLAQHIQDGTYPPMALLPAEQSLVAEYGVSRVTVRRALALLEEDGYVTRRKGIGTFANLLKTQSDEHVAVSGPLENLVAQGVRHDARTLFWGEVVPPLPIAQKLNLTVGEHCLLVRRVRNNAAQPFSYTCIYLPRSVGACLIESEASDRLIIEMLDQTPYRPAMTEHALGAVLADGEAAKELDVPVGSPLLRMRGVAWDENEKPIYYQESLYHPSKYEYAIRMQRDDGSSHVNWRNVT